MPSEDSSSDDPVCRCGHIKSDHKDSGEGSCCYQHRAPYYCHGFEPKADDAAPCRCGHPASSHYGAQGCIGNRNLCPCKGYLPQGGAEEPQRCGEEMYRHSGTALLQCQRNAGHDGPHRWISGDDRHEWTTAPPRLLDCGLCFEEDGKEVHPHPECRLAKQAPEEPEAAPPPRPPYAVAYSVGGQLFESWLPGDATAVAQDGVLIIQHSGPVAGIVRVSPVKEG